LKTKVGINNLPSFLNVHNSLSYTYTKHTRAHAHTLLLSYPCSVCRGKHQLAITSRFHYPNFSGYFLLHHRPNAAVYNNIAVRIHTIYNNNNITMTCNIKMTLNFVQNTGTPQAFSWSATVLYIYIYISFLRGLRIIIRVYTVDFTNWLCVYIMIININLLVFYNLRELSDNSIKLNNILFIYFIFYK